MYIDFPEVQIPVEGMEQIHLPKMVRIEQKYDRQKIEQVEPYLLEQLQKFQAAAQKFAGKRIAVTVGSRGIPHLDGILKTLCRQLERWGASPFLVPAMGSHGGGSAEGQLALLEGYHITSQSIGVPIYSGMEVVQYGELEGIPLYCDQNAFLADGVIVLNKIKPHTDFRGEVESGLCKMIAIGLGKHKGASALHARGFAHFARLLPMVAQKFLEKVPVFFAIGLVQNAYDEICELEVMASQEMIEREQALLKIARKKLATFKFRELDVLVIDEIGKNISGFGYDPNVVGRMNSGLPGFSDILKLQRLLIRGLTEETHHNGCGISAADITTRRCLNDIDWEVVWTNMTTSMMIQGGKIPFYLNNDLEALRMAIRTCCDIQYDRVRMARIRNTLSLYEIEVSEALFEEIRDRPDVVRLEGPYEMHFDQAGYLLSMERDV